MSDIDVLLQENRKFAPPDSFRRGAHVVNRALYDAAEKNPEAFWDAQASELEWYERWTKVLDWTPPHAKWFVGGKLNISVNCVDRHIRGPRRNKAALVWEG